MDREGWKAELGETRTFPSNKGCIRELLVVLQEFCSSSSITVVVISTNDDTALLANYSNVAESFNSLKPSDTPLSWVPVPPISSTISLPTLLVPPLPYREGRRRREPGKKTMDKRLVIPRVTITKHITLFHPDIELMEKAYGIPVFEEQVDIPKKESSDDQEADSLPSATRSTAITSSLSSS